MKVEVIVVGCGPVGALLAAELRLAGVSVVVLERLAEPSGHSRAFRLQPRTLELLDQRGLLGRFLEGNRRWPKAHFAGIEPLLELERLPGAHPYALLIPQARTEELLEKHRWTSARTCAAARVHGLTSMADGVLARVRGPDGECDLATDYLVGCDGGRSTGVGWPASGSAVRIRRSGALLGDVELRDPMQLPSGVPSTLRTPRGLLMAISVVPA